MGKYTVHRIFRNIYLQYKNIIIKPKRHNVNQRATTQKLLFLFFPSEAQSLDSDKKLSK